ncbi:MAG: sterol desaturase family protein [Parvularculaceae bacterium]
MTLEPALQAKGAIAFGVFAALVILERVAAAVPAPVVSWRVAKNVGLGAMTYAASPLILLPLALWADANAPWERPASWSGAATLIADVLILDLWTYALHRAYHRVPAMWRLHAPHHLDEHLDATSAIRFHVGEVALSGALRLIPLLALSIPFAHVVVYELLLFACAAFQHSNWRLPPSIERPLSRVVVTPSIHWVHHHAVRADTDSNFCSLFSWWDGVFGTRSGTVRTPRMPIGVEGARDRSFAGLLAAPFRAETERSAGS